jgi:hypothetical protein
MQKQGYRSSSGYYGVQALKSLARRVNLLDPKAVKEYVAKASCTESRKLKRVNELIRFYKVEGDTL